jgi:hypothetical protein
MAVTLTGSSGNSPISVDLMYQFYDNKAITPQIRAALQKKQDEAAKEPEETSSSKSSSDSKFGPATRVNITDQIVRMSISSKTTKKEEEKPAAETDKKKPSRYDVLAEVKKSVAEREAVKKAEKDAQLKEIADKIAADEEAKKKGEEENTGK